MSMTTGLIAKTLLSLPETETEPDVVIPTTEIVNENKTLGVDGSYIITGNVTLTIPNSTDTTLKTGDLISLKKLYSVTPVLTCASNLFSTINGEDTSIIYDTNTSLYLIFNATTNKWEVVAVG